MHYNRENSQKLCQQRKWALWMRHLIMRKCRKVKPFEIPSKVWISNDWTIWNWVWIHSFIEINLDHFIINKFLYMKWSRLYFPLENKSDVQSNVNFIMDGVCLTAKILRLDIQNLEPFQSGRNELYYRMNITIQNPSKLVQIFNANHFSQIPFQIWCLIHNAHLGKIPSFWKIADLKITHLKKIFDLYFLNICHWNSGLAFKSKNYYITE
jgi:hypothetical protein